MRRTLTRAVLGTAVLASMPSAAAAHGGGGSTRFFVPPPHQEAVKQALQLVRQHRLRDALRIAALESKPEAGWVTQGTPAEAGAAVRDTIRRGALETHQGVGSLDGDYRRLESPPPSGRPRRGSLPSMLQSTPRSATRTGGQRARQTSSATPVAISHQTTYDFVLDQLLAGLGATAAGERPR
jgi:hypothetical protein